MQLRENFSVTTRREAFPNSTKGFRTIWHWLKKSLKLETSFQLKAAISYF